MCMSTAELRARQLFNDFNLRNEDEEVRRNLMILLLSVKENEKRTKLCAKMFAGKWQGDETAEEIIESIREDRTSNREIEL